MNQNKILWWIMGAIFGPLTLATISNMTTTTYTTSNRVTALEVEFRNLHSRLERIETKLDTLIDRP